MQTASKSKLMEKKPIKSFFPLKNLGKCFLKHELNVNLNSMSHKLLTTLFFLESNIDRVL